MRSEGEYNHDYCILDEVVRLMKHGFTCYLEEELWKGPSMTKRGSRVVVDIYAIKKHEKILVEVGTLSGGSDDYDRLSLLKKLMPDAKVVHIHQWKNYGINGYIMYQFGFDWKIQQSVYVFERLGGYRRFLQYNFSSVEDKIRLRIEVEKLGLSDKDTEDLTNFIINRVIDYNRIVEMGKGMKQQTPRR